MVVAASGALLASACSSSKAGVTAARPTIATAVESTTTTNPYAVPPVIDVAYVNRVLAGLDAAVGDVVRLAAQAGAVTPEALDRMRALYMDPALNEQINYLVKDSASGFPGLPSHPGNRKTVSTKVVSGVSSCIFVQVNRDFSAVSIDARTDISQQYVGLRPLEPGADREKYNPTGWAIIYDGFQKDRSQPPDPCAHAS